MTRTVQNIYETYRIMPALQMHQLRVAAVAQTLCNNFTRDVDTHPVVLACLFHDMGNIIKSDLDTFPEFLEPEGKAHWAMVKTDFIKRYGNEQHTATLKVVREFGLTEQARALIDSVAFSKLLGTRDGDSYEQKIVEYSDCRVGPHGVLSLDGRLLEARNRYAARRSDIPRDAEAFETHIQAAHDIEQQIFAEATIAPDDITEQSVQPLIGELRGYEVI